MYIALAVLFLYLIAVVVAGHGFAPMAFFLFLPLVMGRIDSWTIPLMMAPGWIGIVGLAFATFRFRSVPLKRITYQFLATIILYLSWLVWAIIGEKDESGTFLTSFELSAPFQITFLVVAGIFAFRLATKAKANRKH